MNVSKTGNWSQHAFPIKETENAFSLGETFPAKPPQLMATDTPNLPALRHERQTQETFKSNQAFEKNKKEWMSWFWPNLKC